MPTPRPRRLRLVPLSLALLALAVGSGCAAGGRVVSEEVPLSSGSLSRASKLWVTDFEFRKAVNTGDGADNPIVAKQLNEKLVKALTRRLVAKLETEGFRVGQGEAKKAAKDRIVIAGVILESDRGNQAQRSETGGVEGRTRVLAQVRLYNAIDRLTTIAEFTVESTRGDDAYGDGIGRDCDDLANAISMYMNTVIAR